MVFWCFFALLVVRAAAMTPISESDYVTIDQTGLHTNVHTATFVCNKDVAGSSSFNISDPETNATYMVTINCQPPVTKFDAVLTGFVPRDVYVYDREVCYVATQQPPQEGSGSKLLSKRVVRPMIAGFVSCLGTLVGVGSCGASGTKKALKAIGNVLVDLKNETETIYKIEQNTKAALDDQTRIDGAFSADIALLSQQNQYEDEAIAGMNNMIHEAINLTESFGLKFAASLSTAAAEIAALTNVTDELEVAQRSFSATTTDNFNRLTSQVQGLARLQQSSELLAYQEYMEIRERRALTKLYLDTQTDTNELFISTSTPLTSPEARDPVADFDDTPDNSFVMAAASMQGTIEYGIHRYFRQRDYAYRCSPLYALDDAPPVVDVRELIFMMGKGIESDPDPLTSCLGGTASSPWTCQCVMEVRDYTCKLQNSTSVMPFDLPDRQTVDLRSNTSFVNDMCVDGVLMTPDGSTPQGMDGPMGAPNVYASSINLAADMASDCGGPSVIGNVGTWVSRNVDGLYMSRRIQRPDYNRFVDMDVPTNATADSEFCISSPSEFAQTGDNDRKPAWVIWYRLSQSYEMTFTLQPYADLEIIHFGVLPAGLTYYEDKFSPARNSNRSQRCTGVAFARLRNHDTVTHETDILGVYKLVPQPVTTSGMTFSVVKVTANQEVTTTGTLSLNTTSGSASASLSENTADITAVVSSINVGTETGVLPWDQLVVETPTWWQTHGAIFDVPYPALSLSGTAISRKGTPTYVHHPADQGGVPSSYNKTQIFESMVDLRNWLDREKVDFDAHSVGDSAQAYARGYSSSGPSQGCTDFKYRNDTSAGSSSFTGNNQLCAFLSRYTVQHQADLTYAARPRDGWATIFTLTLPTGLITTGFASVCPTYGVDVEAGQTTLTLRNTVSAPITVCLVVTGGDSVSNLLQICSDDHLPSPVTIGGGATYDVGFTFDTACPVNYVQVYTLGAGQACTANPPSPAKACYSGNGISVVSPTSSGSLNDDNGVVSNAVTVLTDQLAQSHLQLASQAADLQVVLADLMVRAHRDNMNYDEIYDEIEGHLTQQMQDNQAFLANVSSPAYINTTIASFNDKIASQSASIAASINASAAITTQVNQNLIEVSGLMANMTALQAANDGLLATLRNLTDKTNNDTNAAMRAISEVREQNGFGFSFGGVGKAFNSALDKVTKAGKGFLKAPFELGQGIMGFLHLIIGLVVMAGAVFGIGYLCYMGYQCYQSRRTANNARTMYSRISPMDSSAPARPTTQAGPAP